MVMKISQKLAKSRMSAQECRHFLSMYFNLQILTIFCISSLKGGYLYYQSYIS